MRRFLAVIAIFALLINTGCGSKTEAVSNDGSRPKVLRLGFSPGQEEVEERVSTLQPVADYLERKLGVDVEWVRTSSYSTIIEAMRADKIDVSSMGPFTYVIASEKTDAELLVALGSEENGPRFYHSYLITHPNSGIRSLEDVVARRHDLILQFVDPASTSGHLVPRGHLMSLGLNPEEDFKRVIFGMGHTTTILTVKSEKVDLAGCASSAMTRLLNAGTVKEGDFVKLWKSPAIPSSPICVRGGLPEAFKEEVRQAFLDMRHDDLEALRVMTAAYGDSTLTYMRTDEAAYAPLRELAFQINLLKKDS